MSVRGFYLERKSGLIQFANMEGNLLRITVALLVICGLSEGQIRGVQFNAPNEIMDNNYNNNQIPSVSNDNNPLSPGM